MGERASLFQSVAVSAINIFNSYKRDNPLSTLDINGDGRVSLEEVFTTGKTAKQMDMEFRPKFRSHDLNDDGYISATEFMEVYKPMDKMKKLYYMENMKEMLFGRNYGI